MDSHDRQVILTKSLKTFRRFTSVPYFDENRPVIYHGLALTYIILIILMILPISGLESHGYFSGRIQASFAGDVVVDSLLSFTTEGFTVEPVGSDEHVSKIVGSCQKEIIRVGFGECNPPSGSLAMECRGYSLDENEVIPIFLQLCDVCEREMKRSKNYIVGVMGVCGVTIKVLLTRSNNLKDSIMYVGAWPSERGRSNTRRGSNH